MAFDASTSVAAIPSRSFFSIRTHLRGLAIGHLTCPLTVHAVTRFAGDFIESGCALDAVHTRACVFAVPLAAIALTSFAFGNHLFAYFALRDALVSGAIPLGVLTDTLIATVLCHSFVAFLASVHIATIASTNPFIVFANTRFAVCVI